MERVLFWVDSVALAISIINITFTIIAGKGPQSKKFLLTSQVLIPATILGVGAYSIAYVDQR